MKLRGFSGRGLLEEASFSAAQIWKIQVEQDISELLVGRIESENGHIKEFIQANMACTIPLAYNLADDSLCFLGISK
jgi:hypothetical protein